MYRPQYLRFCSICNMVFASRTMVERCIPSDIVHNILVRIPASSLQRLKLVSKGWFRVISDQDFAEAHLAHQSRDEFSWCLFLNTKDEGIFFMGGSSSPNRPQPMNLPGASKSSYVYGSFKGLVLYSRYGEGVELYVANPITRESLLLPQFYRKNESIVSASIGCGCGGGDIKVVLVSKPSKHNLVTPYTCGILNLGSSSWREMRTPISVYRLERPYVPPVFARGALHWCYDTGILSLDLDEEKFQQNEVTFCSSSTLKTRCCYMEWDGCYAVIFRCYKRSCFYRIWTLRESGWMKEPDIDSVLFERLGYAGTVNERPCISRYLSTTVRNGKIVVFKHIVRDNIDFLMYDFDRGAMTKFGQFDVEFLWRTQRRSVVAHVNSIISWQTKRLSVVGDINSTISCPSSPNGRPVLRRTVGLCKKVAIGITSALICLHKFATECTTINK